MIIDISPMSGFLQAALYLVGIPAIILSLLVFVKITRSFYGKRDYNLEMPEEHPSEQSPPQAASGQAGKESGGAVHQSHSSRDSMNARMIQSG